MNPLRAAIALYTIAGTSAFAAGDHVQKQLEANYVAMSAAFTRKDISAIGKFYAPSFVSLDSKGKMTNRDKILSLLRQQMKNSSDVQWSRKVTKLTVVGNTATALVRGFFKATMGPHKIKLTTLAINVWAKAGNNWQMTSSKPISNSLVQDGKLMSTVIRRKVMPPKTGG